MKILLEKDFLEAVKKAKSEIEKDYNIKVGTLTKEEKNELKEIFIEKNRPAFGNYVSTRVIKDISGLKIIYYNYIEKNSNQKAVADPLVFLYRDEKGICKFKYLKSYIKKYLKFANSKKIENESFNFMEDYEPIFLK